MRSATTGTILSVMAAMAFAVLKLAGTAVVSLRCVLHIVAMD
jgi:hypothetical protein